MLGQKVVMGPEADVAGEEALKLANNLKDGEVLLLGQLRTTPEEEANDLRFAAKLAKFGDIFVNDAYGTAHRKHASTEGITH